MTKFFWRELGDKKKKKLIFLHGWGLNSAVWSSIEEECSKYFNVYFLDLPGYGRNNSFYSSSLYDISELIWQQAPKDAIWIGWSLGGLIAKTIAINHQAEILGLITVASTPCFIEKKNWYGINPILLNIFAHQLKTNFQNTIKRFLSIQSIGTSFIARDIDILKKIVLNQPLPSLKVLDSGLDILKNTDLRKSIALIKKPFLRIYGELDILVPNKVVSMIDYISPTSISVIVQNSAHAPFISHPNYFLKLLIDFCVNF